MLEWGWLDEDCKSSQSKGLCRPLGETWVHALHQDSIIHYQPAEASLRANGLKEAFAQRFGWLG